MLCVSTPDRRARDKDRDAAIEVVEAAWADGQIVEMDRDKRVEELLRAHTLAEIDMLTRDLQPAAAPAHDPVPEPVPVVDYGPPLVPDGPAPTSLADFSIAPGAAARVAKLPKVLFLIPAVAVLVVVVGIVAALLVGTSGDVDDFSFESPEVAVEQPVGEVLTVEGYDDLVAAVVEQSGRSQVFDAVLYPSYAVVSIPADATSEREESFYWDGTDLRSNQLKTMATTRRFDLGRVDGAVVIDLVERVRGLVADPTTWYAVIRAPDTDRSMIWAYATDEYGESVYLGARRDGTVVYDSTEH